MNNNQFPRKGQEAGTSSSGSGVEREKAVLTKDGKPKISTYAGTKGRWKHATFTKPEIDDFSMWSRHDGGSFRFTEELMRRGFQNRPFFHKGNPDGSMTYSQNFDAPWGYRYVNEIRFEKDKAKPVTAFVEE